MFIQVTQVSCLEVAVLCEDLFIKLFIVVISCHDIRSLDSYFTHTIFILVKQNHMVMFYRLSNVTLFMHLVLRPTACNKRACFSQSIAQGIWEVAGIEEIPNSFIQWGSTYTEEPDAASHGGDKLCLDSLQYNPFCKRILIEFGNLRVISKGGQYSSLINLLNKERNCKDYMGSHFLEGPHQYCCCRRFAQEYYLRSLQETQQMCNCELIAMAHGENGQHPDTLLHLDICI